MSVGMGEDEEFELWEERKEGSADRREVLLCKRKEGMVKKVLAAQIETGLHIYTSTRRVPSSIPAGFTILFLLVLVSSGLDATLCFAVLCGLLEQRDLFVML